MVHSLNNWRTAKEDDQSRTLCRIRTISRYQSKTQLPVSCSIKPVKGASDEDSCLCMRASGAGMPAAAGVGVWESQCSNLRTAWLQRQRTFTVSLILNLLKVAICNAILVSTRACSSRRLYRASDSRVHIICLL